MAYNTIPNIIINDITEPPTTQYGYSTKLCVIGPFKSNTRLAICRTKEEALNTFGNNGWADRWFNILYRGDRTEDILIYNTEWEWAMALKNNELTTEGIEQASENLRYEDFDILIPLGVIPLSSGVISKLDGIHVALRDMASKYLREYYKPIGVIYGIDFNKGGGVTTTHMKNWQIIWKDDNCYKAVITPIILNGEQLDLCSSAIYHAQITANRPVYKSETMMVYDEEYTGLSTYDYARNWPSIRFHELLDYGFFTVAYFDRGAKTMQCISNITPSKYDMRILRSFNYLLKNLGLDIALGQDNNPNGYRSLEGNIKFAKTEAIKMGLCTDLEYNIQKNPDYSDRAIVTLSVYFDDIIRTIQTNIRLNIN